jgi:hypothetical protein
MAEGTITLQSEEKAQAWLQKCKENNKELQECIGEIAKLLEAAGQSAEGDVVNTFIQFSTRAKNAATGLFNAVSTVASTVNSLIDTYKGLSSGIIGAIGRFATGG